jgi:hypothetical protein
MRDGAKYKNKYFRKRKHKKRLLIVEIKKFLVALLRVLFFME